MLVLVAALGAACGRDAAPAPQSSGNAINAQPRDRVQQGGTLTWPIGMMPPNFNYHELDGDLQNNWQVIAAVMPLISRLDASGTVVWNMDYLAAEPVLTTTPAQVVRYRINPKAVWSDGTPITWQDFYWQWKANNGENTAYHISRSTYYRDIGSVTRGADDREAVVTFKVHFADWRASFYPLYPASTNKSPEAFNDGWKGRIPVTAGPFKLDHIDETAKTIVLVRDDRWWGPPARLDRIVYRNLESDAQVDALANGEVDVMEIAADADKYARARTIGGIDIRATSGPAFEHLNFNGMSPFLSDVRVRKALAMAVDRAAIARASLSPVGVAATAIGNHIFMPNMPGYRDNSGDVGRFDPDAAARLLDEAGWRLSGTVRQKDGRPMRLRLVLRSGNAVERHEDELVQNMLARVGVAVSIDSVPASEFYEKYITPGQFDLTIYPWMGMTFPISASTSIYLMPTKTASGDWDIQENDTRIGSPELDRVLLAANRELDPQKAIDTANQADAMIWQEVHSLVLYQRPDLWACKKGLANFGAPGLADLIYEDIGWLGR